MPSKAILLAGGGGGGFTPQQQKPFSRFYVTFGEEDGYPTYGKYVINGEVAKEVGSFTLIQGDELVFGTQEIQVRVVSTAGFAPLVTATNTLLDADMKLCWLVNETTGQTIYGIAFVEGNEAGNEGDACTYLAFGYQTKDEALAVVQAGIVPEMIVLPTGPVFTLDDVGTRFTMSIYVDGYGYGGGSGGSNTVDPNSYSTYEVTVGYEEGTGDFPFSSIGYIDQGETKLGSATLKHGQDLTITSTSGNQEIYFAALSLNGSVSGTYFTFPLSETQSGLCRVVNQRTGVTCYGVYGPDFFFMIRKGKEMMACFPTLEDAYYYLENKKRPEDVEDISIFSSEDVGKKCLIAIYLEDPPSNTEPDDGAFSRFKVTCGYNEGSTAAIKDYGYSSYASSGPYGSISYISGSELATEDKNGNLVTEFVSAGNLNVITCPIAETNEGICRVVDETTGAVVYGLYGGAYNAFGKPYAFFVMFKSYEDAAGYYLDTKYQFEYAAPFFTEADLGTEHQFAIYLEETPDVPPTPVGPEKKDRELQFTARKNGENVAYFSEFGATAHPDSSFEVYINGTKTTQSYKSLTFSAGDVVRILGKDVVSFPKFSANGTDYMLSLDTPLPFMSDEDGNGITSANSMFAYSQNIKSIPVGMFDNNPDIVSFDYLFRQAIQLNEVPAGLFAKCNKATSFRYMFTYGDFSVIPGDLFGQNEKVTSMYNTFMGVQGCENLPEDLFAGLPNLTDVNYTFYYCWAIKSIPEGLFRNNTKLTSFVSTFHHCTEFTEIPANLFANNTLATAFAYTFSECESLVTIPSSLFSKNTEATTFNFAFKDCPSLVTIPAGLFDSNTKATTFWGVFQNCSSLTTVPSGLFDKNVNAGKFALIFAGCPQLRSVPENLFEKNVAVTDFSEAFSGCTTFSGRVKIGSTKVTNATDFCSGAGAVTVFVPAGSTTETTFRTVASTLTNLTVQTY